MEDTPTLDIADLLIHATFVRGMARAVLRGDGLADDIVQETWFAALKAKTPRRGEARPWLSGVVRNIANAALRSDRRRDRREQATARTESVPSTADVVAKEEIRRRLVQAVLALREPYRSAIMLRYYEDLPPRTVAAQLGVPVETVRTRVKRGLQMLRDDLDDKHEDRRAAWGPALLALAEPLGVKAATVGTAAIVGRILAAAVLFGVFTWAVWPGAETEKENYSRDAHGNVVPRLIGRASAQAATTDATGRCVLYGTIHGSSAPGTHRIEIRTLMSRDGAWTPASTAPVLATSTSGEGTYLLRGLRTGAYEVRVLRPDGDSVMQSVALHANGQHQRLDFEIPATPETLTGQVRWRDGRPCRGWITLGHPRRITAFVRTDASGRFALKTPTDKMIRISAIVPGIIRVSQWVDREKIASGGLEFVIDEGLVVYEGRVLSKPEGSRVRDARVSYLGNQGEGQAMRSVWTWTRSDVDGRFQALVFPGAKPRVEDGHHLEWTPAPPDETGAFRLGRAARIEGTVRDEQGRPVGPGIAVVATTLGRRETEPSRTSHAFTDKDGRYALSSTPGRVFVFAHGNGRCSPFLAAFRKKTHLTDAFDVTAGRVHQHDLAVVACAALQGRVVDEDGAPVVGALVTVRLVEPGTHQALRGRVVSAATDERGTFYVADVVPGVRVKIQASHPEYITAESSDISLDQGAAAEVTLSLAQPRTAMVRVLDARTGEPVAGASIQVRRRSKRGWGYDLGGPSAVTDDEGRVRVNGVSPGPCGMTAYASGYVNDPNPRLIAESKQAGDFETIFRLEPEMTIRGKVVAPEGLEVSDARVALIPIGNDHSLSYSPGGRQVDVDGTFQFTGQKATQFRLRAWLHAEGSRYAAQLDVTKAQDDIELHLTGQLGEGEWLVRALDQSGRPVPASVARVLSASGYMQWGVSQDGIAWFPAFEGPAPDTYLLVIPGYRSQATDPKPGALVLGPLPGDGGQFEARLPVGRTMKGVVRFADESPAAGLRLRITPILGIEAQWQTGQGVLQTRTDAEGRFTVDGLGSMSYRVEFEARQDGWKPDPAVVSADDRHPIIRLPDPPDTMELQVTGPNGRPAGGTYVVVYDSSPAARQVASGTTRGDGSVRLRGLDPQARYRLIASKWQPTPAAYESDDWSPEDKTIRLADSVEVTGEVRDAHGHLLGPVRVYRRSGAGIWLMLQERVGNPWRGFVPPGRHLYRAVGVDENRPTPSDIEGTWIQSGSHNVQLVYEPGAVIRVRVTDWPTEASSTAYLIEQNNPSAKPRRAWWRSDGHIEYLRLDPQKSYTLWASTDLPYGETERGMCVLVRDLRADGQERIVSAVRSAPAYGLLRLPPGVSGRTVKLHANVLGITVPGRVNADGQFRVPGLPEGSWPLLFEIPAAKGYRQVREMSDASGPMDVDGD